MISYKIVNLNKIECNQKGKAKYLFNGNECFAEEAIMNHYKSLGYDTLWSENYYWWEIMALLFWDEIFSKVYGAVVVSVAGVDKEINPNDDLFDQIFKGMDMPADFFTPKFYQNRKELIRNKLQELENCDLEERFIDYYRMNYGKNCRAIVDWDKFKLEELLIAIKRINKKSIIRILNRLLMNFGNNRSGFPDILVYNRDEIFFSEVKSEKDKLSENQKEWIDFLSTELDLKTEIVLINQTEEQIKKIKKNFEHNDKIICVSFGKTTSKKLKEAIEFLKKQQTYFSNVDEKNEIHGAKFKLEDIESVFLLLAITKGWKSLVIEIDGTILNEEEFVDSFKCYKDKSKNSMSIEWCKMHRSKDNAFNIFGCKAIKFREFEDNWWIQYGFVDKKNKEWIFDKSQVENKLNEELEKIKYCPILNKKQVMNAFEKLPKKVNPIIDKNWTFISNDYRKWIWFKDKWVNNFGLTNYPGIEMMIGVSMITNEERNGYIKASENRVNFDDIIIKYSKKKKKDCFIATAVYGSEDAKEVKVLKDFRDIYLRNTTLGRLLIAFYTLISPFIAYFLSKSDKLSYLVKKALDIFVENINKKYFGKNY